MRTNRQNKTYEFTILRPGGNDTMLIKGIVKKQMRKPLNDSAMKRYPSVEQVGFYSYSFANRLGKLEMAGGEFCGNALRSLAYLLLKGNNGEMKFKVSGTKQILIAGVKKPNTAYAQMPIIKNTSCVKKLRANLWQVDLEGITYLITITQKRLGAKKAKTIAKKLLNQANLLETKLASGVIFVRRKPVENEFFSEPVVWVRNIETLFYETACASGTAAIGLWNSLYKEELNSTLQVTQPSGFSIQVIVQKSLTSFQEVIIEGPVEILTQKGRLSL